mmetsp:Transcript_44831/g.116065  ORF Transcript_44831/g.116065 Transcript_44831/m.116065 type:complete len:230 (+) Transcript_44831:1493-2182(+)
MEGPASAHGRAHRLPSAHLRPRDDRPHELLRPVRELDQGDRGCRARRPDRRLGRVLLARGRAPGAAGQPAGAGPRRAHCTGHRPGGGHSGGHRRGRPAPGAAAAGAPGPDVRYAAWEGHGRRLPKAVRRAPLPTSPHPPLHKSWLQRVAVRPRSHDRVRQHQGCRKARRCAPTTRCRCARHPAQLFEESARELGRLRVPRDRGFVHARLQQHGPSGFLCRGARPGDRTT